MTGWAELDLEGKANVLWAVAGIAVCGVFAYAAVKMIQTQKKLNKRLGLGDDEAP